MDQGKSKGSAATPRWSIVIKQGDNDLVVVPVILPVTAVTMVSFAIITVSYLIMKHRERIAKIKSGALNK
jgi:hypothetical protein